MTPSQEPSQGDDPARPRDEPQPPPDLQPPLKQQRGTQVLSIVGFACAAVAVVFLPPLFGLAGIVLGIVGHTRGEPLGKWAAIAGVVGMIIGMLLSFLVAGTMTR